MFSDDGAADAWARTMAAQSNYATGVEAGAGDRIITLSTCTGESAEERYVVQAVFRELITPQAESAA